MRRREPTSPANDKPGKLSIAILGEKMKSQSQSTTSILIKGKSGTTTPMKG